MTLTKKKWMALLLAMTMVLSAVGLGLSTSVASAATKAPKKIYLKATSKTVDIKGKVVVSVKSVSPKNASKSVTWRSSNKRIATVSSKGTVTGKRSGKVKITATSKKNKRVKKSITITVRNLKPKVYGLPSKATVYSGTKKTLKARMGTGVYNKGITWKSSNSSVASVSSKGVVTAKKKGSATITAYSKESKKYKDTCKIDVRQSATSLKFKSSSVEVPSGMPAAVRNTLTIAPSNVYSKTVTYSSSNNSVATVDSKGAVKGIKPGSATITATTKYGVKKTASYKVIVYDVLKHVNGTYTLDEKKYGSYKILAERDGSPESIVLTNADINNMFGYGNVGFDWNNAKSVENNFANASFSYMSGGDYIFTKKGNKITIKFGKDLMRTNWYYVEGKSYKDGSEDNDYSITLYQTTAASDKDESITLVKTGNTLTANKAGKSIKLEKDKNNKDIIKIVVGAQNKTLNATFEYVDKYTYKATLGEGYITKYKVQVYAYK